MRLEVLLLAAGAIGCAGVWGLVAKLSQARIAKQVLLWSLAGDVMTLLYLAATGALWPVNPNPAGIAWAVVTGLCSAGATIAFYKLLETEATSLVVPLTAVYPAITAVLGFWFLSEPVTADRIIGIVAAVLAVYFLNR